MKMLIIFQIFVYKTYLMSFQDIARLTFIAMRNQKVNKKLLSFAGPRAWTTQEVWKDFLNCCWLTGYVFLFSFSVLNSCSKRLNQQADGGLLQSVYTYGLCLATKSKKSLATTFHFFVSLQSRYSTFVMVAA